MKRMVMILAVMALVCLLPVTGVWASGLIRVTPQSDYVKTSILETPFNPEAGYAVMFGFQALGTQKENAQNVTTGRLGVAIPGPAGPGGTQFYGLFTGEGVTVENYKDIGATFQALLFAWFPEKICNPYLKLGPGVKYLDFVQPMTIDRTLTILMGSVGGGALFKVKERVGVGIDGEYNFSGAYKDFQWNLYVMASVE